MVSEKVVDGLKKLIDVGRNIFVRLLLVLSDLIK